MKNRKKLTDDQLDAVSGGGFTDISDTDIINLLERKLCPSCRNAMTDTVEESIPALHCSLCKLSYTKNSGHWQKFREDDPSISFGMSC